MCNDGKVCWVAPELSEQEQAELEAHIAKLMAEADAQDAWEADGGR